MFRNLRQLIPALLTAGILSVPATLHESENPHYTFIHSAWMGGWQWQGLTQEMGDAAQYATPDLPAHGSDKTAPSDVSLASYAETVANEINNVDGKTILVSHSFGGVVASQTAEMVPEKIAALVYVCAFMLPDGASFMDAINGVEDSVALNNLQFSEDGTTVVIKDDALHSAVGHDVPLDAFAAAGPYLVAEPVGPLGEAVSLSAENYGSIPKYYVECTDDRAIPVAQQRGMYEAQPVEAVYSLATSHLPMFSNVTGLAEALQDIAARVNR